MGFPFWLYIMYKLYNQENFPVPVPVPYAYSILGGAPSPQLTLAKRPASGRQEKPDFNPDLTRKTTLIRIILINHSFLSL